jgi:hypothetical protein
VWDNKGPIIIIFSTHLTDVTAPGGLLVERGGDQGDVEGWATLGVHDQAKVQAIVVHLPFAIAARRGQQVAR